MFKRKTKAILLTGAALALSACGATASAPPPPSAMKAEPKPVSLAAAGEAQAGQASAENVDERLAALEKQVLDLRNDMSQMMPALTKLVSAQQDLQQVLNKLETASGGSVPTPVAAAEEEKTPAEPALTEGTAAPQSLMPAIANPQAQEEAEAVAAKPLSHDEVPPPEPAAAAEAEPEGPVQPQTAIFKAEDPAESSEQSAAAAETGAEPAAGTEAVYDVSRVRFGEHASMTRLVLDASGKVPYSFELDKAGTGLTVHLPQTSWKTQDQETLTKSPVVESYTTASDGEGGTVLSLKLKKPVSVSWADVLPPSAGSGHRVVMDLTPKS